MTARRFGQYVLGYAWIAVLGLLALAGAVVLMGLWPALVVATFVFGKAALIRAGLI